MDQWQLPSVSVGQILGLLEKLDQVGGKQDLYKLASEIHFELGEILKVVDAAGMLKLVKAREGDVILTPTGKNMVEGDIHRRKKLFLRQIKKIPIFQEIISALKAEEGKISRETFQEKFSSRFAIPEADAIFRTIIDWGRYAELLSYSEDEEKICLEVHD